MATFTDTAVYMGREHGTHYLDTAVYTALVTVYMYTKHGHVRGRVYAPCTWPCTWAIGRKQPCTAKPIEMPFGIWNPAGPNKHVLGEGAVHTSATTQ